MKKNYYHFYFNEGGIFGFAKYGIFIRKKRDTIEYQEEDIRNYYVGYLPLYSIRRYLQLFHKAYPKCLIHADISSDLKWCLIKKKPRYYCWNFISLRASYNPSSRASS